MWYKIKARTGGGEVCGIRLRPGLSVWCKIKARTECVV